MKIENNPGIEQVLQRYFCEADIVNETLRNMVHTLVSPNEMRKDFPGIFDRGPSELKSITDVLEYAKIYRVKMLQEHGVQYETDDMAMAAAMINDGLYNWDLPLSVVEEAGLEKKITKRLNSLLPARIPKLSRFFREEDVGTVDDPGNNPYLKCVRFDGRQWGKLRLDWKSDAEDNISFMEYDSPVRDRQRGNYILPRIGVFAHRYAYPYVDGAPWLKLTVYETCSMEKPIQEVSGNVLVLGLRLGYFEFMAALKDEVKQIVVVEENQVAIDMFYALIWPQFGQEQKDKITILHSNPLEALRLTEDGRFDYCLEQEIYDPEDSCINYLKLKEICKKFHQTKVHIWKETEKMLELMDCVHLVIAQAYTGIPIDYKELTERHKPCCKYFENLLTDVVISTSDDMDRYLKFETILELLA